jgi:hypothetical protein
MPTAPNHIRDKSFLLLIWFLFYYLILLSFFHDDRLLSQYQPLFFNHNRDLTELALIAAGLPRWMIAHPASFAVADVLAFLLPVLLLVVTTRSRRAAPVAGILFLAYFALYLLLADIFWQVHHEPFILLLLLGLALTTDRPERFYRLLAFARYYFLYIFVSAALWKLARGAVFNGAEMSRILLLHHTDLLTDPCVSVACRGYHWLIDHPGWSYTLYLGGTLLEAAFIIGFFTRRWDRLLAVLAIIFVVADLLVMRIPYWTILIGIFSFRRRPAPPPPAQRKIVIYETTHHENLPALLDLSEARFSQVAVFLTALSYHNLSGQTPPEQRWPRTDFFIQTPGCPNRRFIRQLFTFIRRHGYTHLHLATLDNNLLIFALRLAAAGPLHVSLTVHEINHYFSDDLRSLRDVTGTIARLILRRRIRHYHFFLPAMANRFQERLPGAATVFIPSRFYSGAPPGSPGAADKGGSPFTIVIPGSIDPNRRNYAEVTNVLTTLLSDPSTAPISLVLLGDAATEAAETIITAFKAIPRERLTLRIYKGYIPQSTYERELAAAQLIWSPLNVHKKGSRNNSETYGLTTASGLTADILLNSVPALVPVDFIIPDSFHAAIYPYRSPEEAAELIRRLLGDPAAYAATREQIHLAFHYFSKENFSHSFGNLTAT